MTPSFEQKVREARAIAEKATPGPFNIERRDQDDGSMMHVIYGKGDFAWCLDDLDRKAKFNAAHIARFHPDFAINLCDEYLKMKAELDEAREVIQSLIDSNESSIMSQYFQMGKEYLTDQAMDDHEVLNKAREFLSKHPVRSGE